MKKLSIKVLRDFAKTYFSYRTPIIRWKKMDYAGWAFLKKRIIYLNPNEKPKDLGCRVGTCHYHPVNRMQLKNGEQHFLTLLHEIGHFKIKKKPLKEWVNLKRKLMREARECLKLERIRDKNFGVKPKSKKEEKRAILEQVDYNAEGVLESKKGESDSYYYGRCEDFRSWLQGDSVSEHISVEEWARKEFKKRRKEIRKLLVFK